MSSRRDNPPLDLLLDQAGAGRTSLPLAPARDLARRAGISLRELELAALKRGICPERFIRNAGEIGLDGQASLLQTRVAIVGLGGLGGFVLEALARLGVAEIVGIDRDTFEESNLNRQLLCLADSQGRAKTQSAGRRFRRINPAGTFVANRARFEDLPDSAFAGCAAVFDCLDAIDSRRRLAERCSRLHLPLVHGAVAGRAAQVAVCPPGANLIERLYPLRCAAPAGPPPVLASTVLTTAGLMVSVALDILLGRQPATPALWVLDLTDGRCDRVEL